MKSVQSNGIQSSDWYGAMLHACNIEERSRSAITAIVEGSDERLVGKSSLLNVIVKLQSLKNEQPRLVESHTCELLYAYELEMDPSVIAYACQPPCKGVVRTDARGRRHVSSAHLDFMVFRHDSITLVECKKASWLESRGAARGWVFDNGAWHHPPYEAFARKLGLHFAAWTPPVPAGTYQSNLELCYAALMDELDGNDPRIDAAVRWALLRRDMTIAELQANVPSFCPRHALLSMARGVAFGPMASVALSNTDSFLLSMDRVRAADADHCNLATMLSEHRDMSATSYLSLAGQTDIARATARLEWLSRIDRGELPETRHSKGLKRKIEAASRRGVGRLEAVLTNYHRSGNRTSRLPEESEAEMAMLISECWMSGSIQRQIDLYYELTHRCLAKGILCPSKKKLWRALQDVSKAKVALETGGKRAFHAARNASDPWERSLSPIAFGQVVHVDSTDMDIRRAPDLLAGIPDGKAKVYVAVDGATGMPVAHALIFGPARTDGLALLHRDYVRRHGRCPVMYHFDRGAENKSHWVDALCRGHTHIRWSPAGGSQFNSVVESTVKQINHRVSHRLKGNTLPDRASRSVDGRFKSRQNAFTSFAGICELVETFLYKDLPATVGADGITANERYDTAVRRWGLFGRPRTLDGDLMWETAVPIKQGRKVVKNRGIRTEDGFYISDEVTRRLGKSERVCDIRADPEDLSFIYVSFDRGIEKAFHSKVQSFAQMTQRQRLFELLWSPVDRANKRSEGRCTGAARYERNRGLNAATNSAPVVASSRTTNHDPKRERPATRRAAPVPEWASLQEFGEHHEDA